MTPLERIAVLEAELATLKKDVEATDKEKWYAGQAAIYATHLHNIASQLSRDPKLLESISCTGGSPSSRGVKTVEIFAQSPESNDPFRIVTVELKYK
jgi:hypothetical protein